MRNVRISIKDLTRACVKLGSVRVEAAGSLYATLATTAKQRQWLSLARISWSFD